MSFPRILKQTAASVLPHSLRLRLKYFAEKRFWEKERERYVEWYRGEISLYGCRPPTVERKIVAGGSELENAAITWCKLRQEAYYLERLGLKPDAFRGKRICDVGCGPHPSALCFLDCEIYGIDPLISVYRRMGFPVEDAPCYHFIETRIEHTPFPNGYFDGVISVNAIDHVDDVSSAAREIRRILRKDGLFQMEVNYHSPTIAEPHVLSDAVFKSIFSWVPNLRKLSEVKDYSRPDIHETRALWSNI